MQKRIFLILSFSLIFSFLNCGLFDISGSNSRRTSNLNTNDGLPSTTAPCPNGYWSATGLSPGCTSCSSVTNSNGTSSEDRKSCGCDSDYTWFNGSCVTSGLDECTANHYSSSGFEPCTQCPSNSNNTGTGNQTCTCNDTAYKWGGSSCLMTCYGGQVFNATKNSCDFGMWYLL